MSSKSIHLSEENTEADDDIESDSFERTLSDRAQQIVHELNNKRKQDNELLSAFKASLLSQVEKTCDVVEQHTYRAYEKQGNKVSAKIQELFQCLERIAKLEMELLQFKQDLKSFFQEVQ